MQYNKNADSGWIFDGINQYVINYMWIYSNPKYFWNSHQGIELILL